MYQTIEIEKFKDSPEKIVYLADSFDCEKLFLINLKKDAVAGKHYHKGLTKYKNPETIIFVSGKIEFTFRDLNSNETKILVVDSPKIIKIEPNIYHEAKALGDSFFLEPYDIESQKDVFEIS